jgi:hypothetical protein
MMQRLLNCSRRDDTENINYKINEITNSCETQCKNVIPKAKNTLMSATLKTVFSII